MLIGGAGLALVMLTGQWSYILGCLLVGIGVLMATAFVLPRRRWTLVAAVLLAFAVAAGAAWMPVPIASARIDDAVVWHRDDLPTDWNSNPEQTVYVSADRLVFAGGDRAVTVDTATGSLVSSAVIDDGQQARLAAGGDAYVAANLSGGRWEMWRIVDGHETSLGTFDVDDHGTLDVIAARKGYAAVRVCPPDDPEAATPTTCTVEGRSPDGTQTYSQRLGRGMDYNLHGHQIPTLGYGTRPGTWNRALLDPRTGKLTSPEDPDLAAEDLMSDYLPNEPRLSSLNAGGAQVLESAGVTFTLDGATLLAQANGKTMWRQEMPGVANQQNAFTVANGQIAVTTRPTG